MPSYHPLIRILHLPRRLRQCRTDQTVSLLGLLSHWGWALPHRRVRWQRTIWGHGTWGDTGGVRIWLTKCEEMWWSHSWARFWIRGCDEVWPARKCWLAALDKENPYDMPQLASALVSSPMVKPPVSSILATETPPTSCTQKVLQPCHHTSPKLLHSLEVFVSHIGLGIASHSSRPTQFKSASHKTLTRAS
jgi:hypothetical protein